MEEESILALSRDRCGIRFLATLASFTFLPDSGLCLITPTCLKTSRVFGQTGRGEKGMPKEKKEINSRLA